MTGARLRADLGLDYLAVGHVTADVMPDGGVRAGGTVTYAVTTAAALGLRAGFVTRARPGRPPLDLPGGVVHCLVASDDTTTFVNAYDATGRRNQTLLALAPPLVADDVPPEWHRVGVLHLAPVAREIGADVASDVAADFVGLTPQGWLRRLTVGQPVAPAPWAARSALLVRVDAVVLSDEDVAGDPERIAWLVERVPLAVVTRGAEGADAYSGVRRMHQMAFRANVVDPTGAGDVFAAALFVRLWEGADLVRALRFAASAGAFKVETVGRGGVPDRAAIEARAATG